MDTTENDLEGQEVSEDASQKDLSSVLGRRPPQKTATQMRAERIAAIKAVANRRILLAVGTLAPFRRRDIKSKVFNFIGLEGPTIIMPVGCKRVTIRRTADYAPWRVICGFYVYATR